MRRRDPDTSRVIVEERQYDADALPEGPATVAPTNQREAEVPDGVTRTVFDSMFGYSNGGFGQSFNAGDAQPPPTYAWANRLRDVCDQVGGCEGVHCSPASPGQETHARTAQHAAYRPRLHACSALSYLLTPACLPTSPYVRFSRPGCSCPPTGRAERAVRDGLHRWLLQARLS